MRNILKLLIFSALIGTVWSCKKEISQYGFSGGVAPVLTADSTDLHLNYNDATKKAFTLSWTNPNYQFTTGPSSQNVNYNIEIDTVGSNFANPNKKVISVSEGLSQTFTESDINDIMLNQLNLQPGVQHSLQVRVTSSLSTNGAVPLKSNVVTITATPYTIPPKVAPPTSGTLYIVGSAVAGGWNNPIDNSQITAQQFTQVSPTMYTLTVSLVGGGEYKLIGVNGSWNQQWSVATKDDPNEIYGGDFVYNGENVLAPPVSGTYKIVVDFQRGKFTVTKQ